MFSHTSGARVSLQVCLHKLGKVFPKEEVSYIRQEYQKLRDKGLSPAKAADQLTARLLAEAQSELADVERQVARIEATGDTRRIQEPAPHDRQASDIPSGRGQKGRRAAGDTHTLDLFTAASLSGLDESDAREQLRADFAVRVENFEVGQLQTSVDHIASPADAAELFRPYANKAQETLVVALLDQAGKVLEVLRHTIGGTAESQAFPHLIVGAVASHPQAAGLWVAHNHPSGKPDPSAADISLTEPIKSLTEAAGLTFGGHVVLGRDQARVFAHDEEGYPERVDYRDLPRNKRVSVTEREITYRDPEARGKITNPASALIEAQKAGSDGVLLLDVQHNVLGFLALTPIEMAALRADQGKGARRVLAALDKSNAGAAIVVTKANDAAAREAADNLGRMLNNTAVRPLDHIALDGAASAAEKGAYPPAGTQFYSRNDDHRYLQGPGELDAPQAPVSAAELNAIVSAMRKGGAWSDDVKVRVLDGWHQLPYLERVQVMADDAFGAQGLYSRGVIYLLRENLANLVEAMFVLGHEAGHKGLDWLLGERRRPVMLSIARDNADVRARAQALMASFPDLDLASATEEVLADRNGIAAWRKLKGWRKLVAAAKAMLRQIMPGLSWTDNDVLHLLSQAAKALQRGRHGQIGEKGVGSYTRSAMRSVEANMRRGREALAKAVTEKTSVHRAMFRNGLGWVDFVWGSEGRVKASGKTAGAMGLAHIIEARMRKDGYSKQEAINLLGRMVETIARGEEVNRTEVGRSALVNIRHRDTEAVLARRAGSNAWVLTGWDVNPGADVAGYDAHAATHATPSLSRNGVGAGFLASESEPAAEASRNDTQRDTSESGSPLGAERDSSVAWSDDENRRPLDQLTQGEAGHFRKAVSLDAIRDRIAAAGNAAGRSEDRSVLSPESQEVSPDKPRYSRTTDPLVRFWKSLASWDDAFKYPRSTAQDLPAILSEIDPAIQAEPSPKLLATMRHTYPGLHTLWTVRMPVEEASPALKQATPGYETAYVYATGDEVWLDVSELQPGVGGGSKLYAAVAQYALNTGKTFIGYPAGLSALGWIRRLENMTSAALKAGTTRHLQPHPDMVAIQNSKLPPVLQKALGKGLDWRTGDDTHNLRELLLASYAMTKALAPEVQDVTYDPGTGQFRSAGQELSEGDFRLLGKRAAGALERQGLGNLVVEGSDRLGEIGVRAPLGSATLKRAAISHSLVSQQSAALDGQGRQRNGLLVAARRWLSGSGVSPAETKILYSRAGQAAITLGADAPVDSAPAPAPLSVPGLDWALQPETSLDDLLTWSANRFHRATQVGEAIQAAGGVVDLDAKTDIDGAERLFHGKASNDIRTFRQDVVAPLLAKMKAAGLTAEDVGAYLYAQHAPERNAYIASINPDNDAGSGLSNAEATQVIIGLDRQGKLVHLRALDADMAALRELQMRELEKAGEIDSDTLQRWRDRYRHYVPLKGHARGEHDEARPKDILGGKPLPKGYSASASLVKRALGRRSLADNPLLLLIHDTEKALVNTRKNEVRQVLLNLVRRYPNKEVWEELDQPPMRSVLVNGQVRYMPDHQGARRREDILLVKEHGRLIYVQLHDAGLQAALKNLNAEGLNMVLRYANALTTWWKASVTSFSPNFVVANLVADWMTLEIAKVSEQDIGILQGEMTARGKDWYARELGGPLAAPKRLGQLARLAVLIGRQRFADGKHALELSTPSAQRWLALYNEMREHGGEVGFLGHSDLESTRSELATALAPLNWRTAPGKALQAIWHFTENINAGAENANRLMAYAMAREAWGQSPEKAALFARTITVDFNRRGTQRWVDVLSPFFNAGVQGIKRLATLVRRGKGQLAKRVIGALAGLAMAGALVTWWNDAVCQRALPQASPLPNAYETQVRSGDAMRMLHIAMPWQGDEGQVFVTARMPHELSPFWNAGVAFYEATFNERPEYAATLLLGSLGHALIPLSGAKVADGLTDSVLGTVMPLPLRPLWESNQNRDSFGTPIHKEAYPNDVSPESTRGRASTGEGYKDMAAWLNESTGGDTVRAGWGDAHPESIRQLVRFGGGGALTFWTQVVNGVPAALSPTLSVPTSQVPFAGRFVREHGLNADRDVFWRYGEQIKTLHALGKAAKTQHKPLALRDGYEQALSKPVLSGQLERALERIKSIQAQRDRAEQTLNGGALQARLNSLEKEERQVYVQFNQRMAERLAEQGLKPLAAK